MVLKQDISSVIEYIGKKESFQFQDSERDKPKEKKSDNELDVDTNFYTSLRNASVNLGIPLSDSEFDRSCPAVLHISVPSVSDFESLGPGHLIDCKCLLL